MPDHRLPIRFPLRLARVLALVLLSIPLHQAFAQDTETILYNFTGGSDGGQPQAGLLFDQLGNLYGTTELGGIPGGCLGNGCGTVFKLTPNGGNGWTESVIHQFQVDGDGVFPGVGNGLVSDSQGNLYGTTDFHFCPPNNYCGGTVFELTPQGAGWNEAVLYFFSGGSDGDYPNAGVVLDPSGTLYGTTFFGGGGGGTCICGLVFGLAQSEGSWTEDVLYRFTGGADERNPDAGVILDKDGNLYGTTWGSGNAYGTVFELEPSANGWTQHVLYTFTGGADGGNPYASLVFDKQGNLFGTTGYGGKAFGQQGCGVVFELTPAALTPKGGKQWHETIVHTFKCGIDGDGSIPVSAVILSPSGDLYGTTLYGGSLGYGTVFKIARSGQGWKETVLHSFGSSSDGSYPYGNVILDRGGHLYGTTFAGGTGNAGIVFEVGP